MIPVSLTWDDALASEKRQRVQSDTPGWLQPAQRVAKIMV